MATNNINPAPSTPLHEEQKVVAQPQQVPKPRRISQKFKQNQDSSMSAKSFHRGNEMRFGQSDPQGLLGSSGVLLPENPKLSENLDKQMRMSHSCPSMIQSPEDHIAKNKEAGPVMIKHESFVSPLIQGQSLTNDKQMQLQDSFAPTSSQMKLAYQQGLLGSSGVGLPENPKLLEDLDKETRMSRSGPSVLLSLHHQIAMNKEAGAFIIKHEPFVEPVIPEHCLRNEKQKQLQHSSAPTFAQMKFAYQQGLLGSSGVFLPENPKLLADKETSMYHPGPSVIVPPENQIAKNKEAGAVIIKRESSVAPMIKEYSLGNEKQKQLQDSFAPIFAQMKLAYQQGLLGSSRTPFQENQKILEVSDKKTSKYRPGPSVIVPPQNQIVKNKEALVITTRECLVPRIISEEFLRKGKQKQVQESFPPTFPQMNLASQPLSASLMNGPCPQLVSEMNLLWLLQQQMQLSRTFEKSPEVVPDVRSIYKPGTCDQRLKKYMYHQQQRPKDNNVEFWGNLVAEFFAPNAMKRLCLSSNKYRQHISCIFPQEAWCCEICNVRPTAGFEISAEVLPRLCKMKFETGMTDEILYTDIPEECCTPSGHIVLNYAKVTEESVYEAARVVREGRLRIMFSSDLKICIWEFCCSFHEVYTDRRSVTPQIHQFKDAIQTYQAFAESSSGIATEEFQRNSNKFASSVRELARVMDKSLINDLGYTKHYIRYLQISEIVSSMKDLMDYSKKYRIGPAEAMAMIHCQSTASSAVAHNLVAEQRAQHHIDDAVSQNVSVISFAPNPSGDEGARRLNCRARATSPTSSTASSKRLIHQEDLTEPKRKKKMTDSGENYVLPAPTKPVFNQPISTTLPSSSNRRLVVHPSIVVPSNTMSVEPNEYQISKLKVEEDLVSSQNLANTEADASIDTKVLGQNENNGKYCYGFETDGIVDMDQLVNLNGASLFPAIHIGSSLTGALIVNDTHRNSQQSNDPLPYLNGEMDSIDDIQFD